MKSNRQLPSLIILDEIEPHPMSRFFMPSDGQLKKSLEKFNKAVINTPRANKAAISLSRDLKILSHEKNRHQ